MYLRWMVRDDGRGVDFGMWKRIPASALYLPLDVHSGAMARALGCCSGDRTTGGCRRGDEALRALDADDPRSMILRSSVRASPAISGRQTVCRLYVARGVSVAPFCGDSDGGSGDCVEILMYNVKRWRYHAECRQWIPERVHGGRCGGFRRMFRRRCGEQP
ncbi:MAG: DUF2400 family protein [Alistipes inops]